MPFEGIPGINPVGIVFGVRALLGGHHSVLPPGYELQVSKAPSGFGGLFGSGVTVRPMKIGASGGGPIPQPPPPPSSMPPPSMGPTVPAGQEVVPYEAPPGPPGLGARVSARIAALLEKAPRALAPLIAFLIRNKAVLILYGLYVVEEWIRDYNRSVTLDEASKAAEQRRLQKEINDELAAQRARARQEAREDRAAAREEERISREERVTAEKKRIAELEQIGAEIAAEQARLDRIAAEDAARRDAEIQRRADEVAARMAERQKLIGVAVTAGIGLAGSLLGPLLTRPGSKSRVAPPTPSIPPPVPVGGDQFSQDALLGLDLGSVSDAELLSQFQQSTKPSSRRCAPCSGGGRRRRKKPLSRTYQRKVCDSSHYELAFRS